MGDDFGPFRSADHADFDPWAASAADHDPWADPDAEHTAHRRRLRRIMLGFVVLSLALSVASLDYIITLGTFLLDLRPAGMAWREWEFTIQTTVVFGSTLGVGLFWGRWPDVRWQRRSGLLLMMCLTDVVMWSIEHAVRLGLSDTPFGHEYFRESLGTALGWAQFALIASLAADLGASLGEARATDMGRAVRSLVIFGLLVWTLRFVAQTNWQAPLWPLRRGPFQRGLLLPIFGSIFLTGIVLVQVTGICLMEAFVAYRHVRRLDAEARLDDSFPPSRSEDAWNEYHDANPDRHR